MTQTAEKLKKAETLVQYIAASDASSFYKMLWQGESSYRDIPHLTQEYLKSIALHDRLYVRERGLVKIIHLEPHPYLIKVDLKNLSQEPLGTTDQDRPMVLLEDKHEAIEKSLWFYEHNILPVAVESSNFSVAAYAAKTYKINALLSEMSVLPHFLTFLEGSYDLKNIQTITLVESTFEGLDRQNMFLDSKRISRIVLSLPETGVLGLACPFHLEKGEIVFHPHADVFLEIGNPLVVTKLRVLPTPIIKYRTKLSAIGTKQACPCAEEVSFILTEK